MVARSEYDTSTLDDLIALAKDNPNHDERGRFASGPGAAMVAKAIEKFGTTDDWEEAAYILPDGRFIDGKRTAAHIVEHETIAREAVGDVPARTVRGFDMTGQDAIELFTRETGAIRFEGGKKYGDAFGRYAYAQINEATVPTAAQMRILDHVIGAVNDVNKGRSDVAILGALELERVREGGDPLPGHAAVNSPRELREALSGNKPTPSLVAQFRSLDDLIAMARDFDEAKHPRDANGKFSDGGGEVAAEDQPGSWQWYQSRQSQLLNEHGNNLMRVHQYWGSSYAQCDEMQRAAENIVANPNWFAELPQRTGDYRKDDAILKERAIAVGTATMIADVNAGEHGTWLRGMYGTPVSSFKVGQEVDIPLASASWNQQTAAMYASGAGRDEMHDLPNEEKQRVLLELHGKGSPTTFAEGLQEVLVSGRYRVVEIKPAGTFTDRGVIDKAGNTVPGSQRVFEKYDEPARIVLEQVAEFAVKVPPTEIMAGSARNVGWAKGWNALNLDGSHEEALQ